MAFDLKPGDRCMLKGDFAVEGQVAFVRGDLVAIEDVDADRLRPGFKYVVTSARLGQKVRLRGLDLLRLECPECHDALSGPGFDECASCGWTAPEKDRPPEAQRGPGHDYGSGYFTDI